MKTQTNIGCILLGLPKQSAKKSLCTKCGKSGFKKKKSRPSPKNQKRKPKPQNLPNRAKLLPANRRQSAHKEVKNEKSKHIFKNCFNCKHNFICCASFAFIVCGDCKPQQKRKSNFGDFWIFFCGGAIRQYA